MLITSGIIALAILLPTDANPDITPLTCMTEAGTEGGGTISQIICIPEEAPDGGHFVEWLDNSPHYSDGYTLLVDDARDMDVYWRYDGQEA